MSEGEIGKTVWNKVVLNRKQSNNVWNFGPGKLSHDRRLK